MFNSIEDIDNTDLIKIYFVGEVPSPWGDKKSFVDQWNVIIRTNNGYAMEMFNYFTGVGLRKQFKYGVSKPVRPKNSDVLHSLVWDATSLDESFENWCSNFGYDSDSIHAFNIYRQCCDAGKKLLKLFKQKEIDNIRELLQDY